MAGKYEYNALKAKQDVQNLTDETFDLYLHNPGDGIRYKIAEAGKCYFSANDAVVYRSLKEVKAYVDGAVVMKNYVPAKLREREECVS